MQPVADSIPLGPFDLHRRIGKGGMGEVWLGVHLAHQLPVAVKVITEELARDPEYLEAFRHEVQATARLDHPGIILVLDHGQVPQLTAEVSGGQLVAGSPYLVMELASAGSLAHLPLPLKWREMRMILLSILRALAYSHAHGLLHRDLKPDNVLIAGPDDKRPGLKLTDFGIAHALETQEQQGSIEVPMGTPSYMAPEQLRGRIRDYGPWTDLYSLGCVTYQLSTGRLPFRRPNLLQLIKAHFEDPVPRFEATTPLPPGFESWVVRLLQKDPAARFQRAADAIRALLALPDLLDADQDGYSSSLQVTPGLGGVVDVTTVLLDSSIPSLVDEEEVRGQATVITGLGGFEEAEATSRMQAAQPEGLGPDTGAVDAAEHAVEPCPDPPVWMSRSWRSQAAETLSISLVGAGLGLYGLRQIPLVDRDRERDVFWDTLREVHGSGLARMIVVSGLTGLGKTRLVEWMCERADELGVATILKAFHGPTTGPRDGIPPMLARHLKCVGLTPSKMLTHVEASLRRQGVTDDYEWRALVELIQPTDDVERRIRHQTVQLSRREERCSIFLRYLVRLSGDRPVLVFLDDVQWGQDTLDFVEHVMRRRDRYPARVLFIATVQDEELTERRAEARQLESIQSLPGCAKLPVSPLNDGDQAYLLGRLLALGPDLVSRVVERTGGNPLFAVQLVTDWVSRGVLDLTPTGFQLKPSERAVLPEDIHAVWSARTERLLDEMVKDTAVGRQQPSLRIGAEMAIELAAVLGQSVDQREWEWACILSDFKHAGDLASRLLATRLAAPADNGWHFTHGMFRESLLRRAEANGRFARQHQICAAALDRCYPGPARHAVVDRIGLHLLQAGELQAALDPLLLAAMARIDRSDYPGALDLLTRREEAVAALQQNGWMDPHRMAKGWVVRARLLFLQFAVDEAVQWARLAADIARSEGDNEVLVDALRVVLNHSREKGLHEDALQISRQVIELCVASGNRHSLVQCQFDMVEVLLAMGRGEQAWAIASEIQQNVEGLGDPALEGRVASVVGRILLSMEDFRGARLLMARALEVHMAHGYRRLAANCINNLGEISRLTGDLARAVAEYEQAIQIYTSLGVFHYLTPVFNLQLVHLEMGQFEKARQGLEEIAAVASSNQLDVDYLYAQCALLTCIAGMRQWLRWTPQWDRVSALLEHCDEQDTDIPWLFELAGKLAAQAGQWIFARQAYERALHYWRTLDRQEEAQTVETVLASMG